MVRALASHQCGSGSTPGVDAICGSSLLLVLSLVQRGFSPGTPVFPSPQKPTFPNSNSTRNLVEEEPLCGCATYKSLFIYFIFYLFIIRFPGQTDFFYALLLLLACPEPGHRHLGCYHVLCTPSLFPFMQSFIISHPFQLFFSPIHPPTHQALNSGSIHLLYPVK